MPKKPACNHEELVDKLTLKDISTKQLPTFFQKCQCHERQKSGNWYSLQETKEAEQLKTMSDTEVDHG